MGTRSHFALVILSRRGRRESGLMVILSALYRAERFSFSPLYRVQCLTSAAGFSASQRTANGARCVSGRNDKGFPYATGT